MNDFIILKDFLVLCETKSFSRTAEHRHVSVSGLSRRIQGLEEWAGTALFERRNGELALTEAGYELQKIVLESLPVFEEFRESVARRSGDQKRRIRFCSPHILSTIFFPYWLPRLQEKFREARLSINSDTLPQCLAELNRGKVDFVVALFDENNLIINRLPLLVGSDKYTSIELDTESLIPISVPNAAGQPLFNLHANNDRPVSFLGYSEECHLGWSLQTVLGRKSLNLQQYHDTNLADGLRHMTLCELGMAWLPKSLIREDLGAKRLVRSGEPIFDISLKVKLLRRIAPLTPEAQRLWDYLIKLKEN
ncbi:LysR family transcriptional regulator [Halomonas sp. KO116]|uniref:LysR family transcriptional regulator n=1 Tax=Halomonas sp. KO116 TaxID=1504981 RepID=UPI0004E45DDA|nr:LysR family transcriptional regulator [Halomonas sp. KO116]AJY50051.1 transcriptional regulator, LysR family [Halomonas sp. KO116]